MSKRKRAPEERGQVIDAQLHLLDRQVLDVDGIPVTVVDDVELRGIEFGGPLPHDPPVIDALLSGPVLGTRIFGGRPPPSRWHRLRWRTVAEISTVIRVGVSVEVLDEGWTERWVRDHIIGRIPGGRHAPD